MTADRYVTLAEVKEMLEAEAEDRVFTPEQKLALEHAKTVGIIKGIRLSIEVGVNFFESAPHRIMFLVPTELVGINKMARSNPAADDPGEETVAARKS